MEVSPKSKKPPEESTTAPTADRSIAPSNTPSRPPSIPYLPNEIIDNILSFCDPSGPQRTTLKSARLVSHAFRELAGRYLFEKVYVDPFATYGVLALHNIARSEKLAHHVKTIVIYTRQWRWIRNVQDDLGWNRRWNPWRHLASLKDRDDFSLFWEMLLHSVKKLPNVNSVYRCGRYRHDCDDGALALALIALSEPLHGSEDIRTLERFEWQWSRKTSWLAPYFWLGELCNTADSDSEESNPEEPEPEEWPAFGMIKHLKLVNTIWPRDLEFQDEEDEGSLSAICEGGGNLLESLTLDFIPVDCETLQGKPKDFFHSDALQAYEGFSYSPRLTRLELSRLTTTADTLLRVLENTSSTLQDLTLNLVVIISPFDECSWITWYNDIHNFYYKYKDARSFEPDDFPTSERHCWETILSEIPTLLPNLSSVCLADLLDTKPHFRATTGQSHLHKTLTG
ncbi:hypothetical protein IWZ00DRAFT_484511 [Phyllosticta capitalensis]|uniref:uncharacterized protein n=1 Tax=Phyllosticta capitalensis TaxID=121624 RepID=UPI00313153BC